LPENDGVRTLGSYSFGQINTYKQGMKDYLFILLLEVQAINLLSKKMYAVSGSYNPSEFTLQGL